MFWAVCVFPVIVRFPLASQHGRGKHCKEPLNTSIYKCPLQGECVEPARTFTLTVNSCLSAQGHGAKGDNIYEFQIEFLEPVEPKVGIFTFLTLAKKKSNFGKT